MYLHDIEEIGVYADDSTPLTHFDQKYHSSENKQHRPVSEIMNEQMKESFEKESYILFMINVSEHCERPLDMFMFLGKYFEKTIQETL